MMLRQCNHGNRRVDDDVEKEGFSWLMRLGYTQWMRRVRGQSVE